MLVHSIFNSVDGEVNIFGQGVFSTFLRLAGCNLRCSWGGECCDTPHALRPSDGKEMSISSVIEELEKIGCSKITITGGEPLLQIEEVVELCRRLPDCDFTIETNGSIEIPDTLLGLRNVYFVIDCKMDSSGMSDNDIGRKNYKKLSEDDYIKFVIYDRDDYNDALSIYEHDILP